MSACGSGNSLGWKREPVRRKDMLSLEFYGLQGELVSMRTLTEVLALPASRTIRIDAESAKAWGR